MRRGVLGAAIGVGVGILVVTLAVIVTTGWLLAFIVPEVLALTTGATTGFVIGWKLDRRRARLRRFWLWLAIATFSWPLCALVPLWAREVQIRWMIAREIPQHPACTLVERTITTFAFDNNPGYLLRFTCSESPGAMLKFYHEDLPKRGWEILPVVKQNDYLVHQFRKPGRMLTVISWRGSYYPDRRERNWVQLGCCLENFTYRCPPLTELGYTAVPPERQFPREGVPVPAE